MDRALVGEPSVSAFLRSVDRNLASCISRIKLFLLSNASPDYYNPTKDLENLKEKVTSVQDLLVDGEARRLGEKSVDEWMDDFKDLLYDVEDILDDINSLNNHQVRVVELYKTSHELKQRLGNILARTEVLTDKAKDLKVKRGVGYAFSGQSKVTLRTPETSSVVDISEIHGREDDKTGIVKRLLEVDGKRKSNYDVLGIVGMGGLGKTTLAQLVFNDPEVEKHFDVKSWVCISNVFDVARATKELIENSGGGGGEQQSLDGLQRRLKKTVENKRFLFVLDDVWSSSEWETMKAPFSSCANGSKILVTTRKIKIVHALGSKDPHKLQGLGHDQCMAIFRDKASVDDEDDQEKLIFGENIVKACGGAPLVVKVIGSMLQEADIVKWRAVSENTASWANINIDEIHPAIRFSYYDLSASLKRCFEYLAIFPADFTFEEDDVVRLWIADGLVEEVQGRMAEDIGAEYYNELKARSLIQENNMMHDIVHHLAIVVSKRFCYKENSKEHPASVRHAFVDDLNAMHYEFLAQAPCLRTLIVDTVGSSIRWDRKSNEYDLQDIVMSCTMLRTLKNCAFKVYPMRIRSGGRFVDNLGLTFGGSFVDNLTHIRYLTIGNSNIKLLPDSLRMLDHLQFLKLAGVENLPDSMSHLSNLRRLSLCFGSISSFPQSICALSQLQVLDLEGFKNLKELPNDIGNLKSLQTLKLQQISISSLPKSICALTQLKVFYLNHCKDLKELPNDIGNLRSLHTLLLRATSLSSLPESICALTQLKVLYLNDCNDLKELPKDIGNLRSLSELDLRQIHNLRVPESILNVTGLKHLLVDIDVPLPLRIESIAGLKKLPIYEVEKEEERRLGKLTKLNILNSLGRQLVIAMENIGGIEEAKVADLKSKDIRDLTFRWSQPGSDERMEVKRVEALEPHHALESLTFSNYGGDKFPTWIMPSNICLSNLVNLKMEGMNKICEMIEMEFVSLHSLWIENCPILRKLLMATPKLRVLKMWKCGELEADSIHLLPSLSDKAGQHSILSQLGELYLDYNIFEYFFGKLRTANSKWDFLHYITLSGGGRRIASLPRGWPSMMKFICHMNIMDIEPGKFQFFPDGDQSPFPPSLISMTINNCKVYDEEDMDDEIYDDEDMDDDRPIHPHRWYTINSDGKVE